MTDTSKALISGLLILVVAIVLQAQGVSSSASAGIVFGLAGAAWGSMSSESSCGLGCLQ